MALEGKSSPPLTSKANHTLHQAEDQQYSSTYHIIDTSSTTEKSPTDPWRSLSVQHANQTIFYTSKKGSSSFLGSRKPEIHIISPNTNRIVAAARLLSNGKKGFTLLLGDPTTSKKRPDWCEVRFGFDEASYFAFQYDGRWFAWRRSPDLTRLKTIGNEDLTLFAMELHGKRVVGEELGHWRKWRRVVSRDQIARLDFEVGLGEELEALCLVAILGYEDVNTRVRKKGVAESAARVSAVGVGVVGVGC